MQYNLKSRSTRSVFFFDYRLVDAGRGVATVWIACLQGPAFEGSRTMWLIAVQICLTGDVWVSDVIFLSDAFTSDQLSLTFHVERFTGSCILYSTIIYTCCKIIIIRQSISLLLSLPVPHLRWPVGASVHKNQSINQSIYIAQRQNVSNAL